MKKIYFIIFGLFQIINFHFANAQVDKSTNLENKITAFNDHFQYDKSILLLSTILNDEQATPYARYEAYLLKSYTYKRLFNYAEVLHNLDLAFAEGLKTDKKQMITNNIKAEKAFVYFDIHQYSEAAQLMNELAQSQYAFLKPDNKSFVIMQEGFLLMKNKQYDEAEKKLDEAIAITQKFAPKNLPNIYGKKIELYNAMHLYDKRDAAFEAGMKYAKQYKIIKYEMYLYEVLGYQFKKNKDYKNALEIQQKFDSLTNFYNATNENGKIQIAEKKLDEVQKNLTARNNSNIKYFLIGMIAFLFVLLLILIKLYKTNKEKRILVEKENERIHYEIEKLSKSIDEKGNAKIDLSQFNFSERQLEIIDLVKGGKSNKEIANQLFISENTVKYHLKVIYDTLQIDHRNKLV